MVKSQKSTNQGLLEHEASADVGAKLVELDLRASLAPRARLVFQ